MNDTYTVRQSGFHREHIQGHIINVKLLYQMSGERSYVRVEYMELRGTTVFLLI